jgi:hypothetical protein
VEFKKLKIAEKEVFDSKQLKKSITGIRQKISLILRVTLENVINLLTETVTVFDVIFASIFKLSHRFRESQERINPSDCSN